MKVKVLFLFTSMLFINICFSQVIEDTLNKALNGFEPDRDAKFGVLKESKGKNYKWDYLYDKTLYKIDEGGAIWLITTYGSSLKVGELNNINSPIEKK